MEKHEWLVAAFEESRPRLQAVAYRLLGSLSEAEDAVQEAWLHLSRSDMSEVSNLGGWLTTVVARISLNMLRARKVRHEESLEASVLEPGSLVPGVTDPEQEALLADSVGLALLALLDPDIVYRADLKGKSQVVRGATAVARQGRAFLRLARFAQPVLVNGAVGVVVAPHGQLRYVALFTITGGKITQINVMADPAVLRQLHLAVLSDR
jgi:predicted RNA polymerase sigma factor